MRPLRQVVSRRVLHVADWQWQRDVATHTTTLPVITAITNGYMMRQRNELLSCSIRGGSCFPSSAADWRATQLVASENKPNQALKLRAFGLRNLQLSSAILCNCNKTRIFVQ